MSKELLELSELYLQIAEEDLKKSTNKGVTELQTELDKENKETKNGKGIRIEREGGGYTTIYPGSPDYEAAKDGTLTVVGSGESRGKVTNNNGKLTSKSEIKSGASDSTGSSSSDSTASSSSDSTGSNTKSDEDAARKARIKELENKLTKKENERKEKIENIGKTDKTEVKPENQNKQVEVKPENQNKQVEVKPENQNTKEIEVKPEKKDYRTNAEKELDKMPKMSKLERQNRLRFGNDEIDRLKQKQIDFRTWKAKSQLPGADRKQLKLDFMNKYPNSITTQQHYGLRDHYDVEGQSLSEQGKKVVDANAVPAEDVNKPKAEVPKKKAEKAAAPATSSSVKVNPEIKEASGCGSKKKKKKTYYEGLDAYESVLAYLMATNQVDTIEEANYVMMEMDGKTIYDIRQLTEGMPSYVRDSIGRQYGTGKYRGQKYTIEDKKNVINWYAGNIPQV
jgi:hypothetical protein